MQRPPARDSPRNRILDGSLIGQIDDKRRARTARISNEAARFLQAITILIKQRHSGTLRRRMQGRSATDPAGRARNQHIFASKLT
jgi:hypothetical protein